MQMIAQDKPLRKVAWKLLASDVAGVKLKVQDAFKSERALFAGNERHKVTRLRKTLGETVNQWIETGFASAPQPAVQSHWRCDGRAGRGGNPCGNPCGDLCAFGSERVCRADRDTRSPR